MKRAIALLLSGLILAAAPAWADVTGTFAVDMKIKPLDTTMENSLVKEDFEALLNLHVTLSGLTGSLDAAFGFNGVEHLITGLRFSLGALLVDDAFVFAQPYLSGGTLIPDSSGKPQLLFVKKRVEGEIDVAGLKLSNLLMLEDTSFQATLLAKDACAAGLCDLIRSGLLIPTSPPGYGVQSQSFGIGDLITLTGQTISGINVSFQTGLNADPNFYNCVKKWCAPAIVLPPGSDLTSLNETIAIEGLSLAGITFNSQTQLRPCFESFVCGFSFNRPWTETLTAQTELSSLADLKIQVVATSQATDVLMHSELEITRGPVDLQFLLDPSFMLEVTNVKAHVALNHSENPVSLDGLIRWESGIGITLVMVDLSATRGNLGLDTRAILAHNPLSGSLAFQQLEFIFTGQMGIIAWRGSVIVTPNGMQVVTLYTAVSF